MMKTLIVYYSYEGSCALIAEHIKGALKADVLELKTENEKRRTGLAKYIWGGRQVMTHARPKLKPYTVDPGKYDLLIIGSPVWAGSPAPALNTFLAETKISGKKLALFCCHAGGKRRFFEKLRAALPGNTIAGEIDFMKPARPPAEPPAGPSAGQLQEEATKKLEEWLRGL
jgi:flavodoxin